MTEKKKGSATAKLKNLLTTGSVEERSGEMQKDDVVVDDVVETPVPVVEAAPVEPVAVETPAVAPVAETAAPAAPSEDAATILKQIKSECGAYVTSKEQHKAYMDAVDKRDAEMANKKLMTMMSQLCTMREDFFKLCGDMEKKIDKFSAKDILDSFKAYGTDMEIMLTDSGVSIGKFDFEKLNTIHQRIMDVVPTDDESLNGLIAERLTDGYSYNGRVLLKEKVKVYKYTEKKTEDNKGEE